MNAESAFDRLRRPTPRAVILLVLAIVTSACVVIDQRAGAVRTMRTVDRIGAAPAAAVSSAWYCPLVTAASGNPGASSVTVLNPDAQTLTGSITFSGVGGEHAEVAVNVAPRSKQTFNPGSYTLAPYVAALVRLAGGGASVEQFVHGPTGDTATPCVSRASDHWYFADGSTESGSTLKIGVFNPFSENAIVDATFATSEGTARPQSLQGVLVPPMTMVVLDVSGNVRRRDYVATSLTLRAGRIAATQLQTGVINGLAVQGYTVGSPDLALTHYVPDLSTAPGRRSDIVLFNPSDDESEVEIDNYLDVGNAEPFALRVPAGGRIKVQFDAEKRIAPNSRLAAVVKVRNGVPVVAQVTDQAVAPNPFVGGAFSTPSVAPARTWVSAVDGVVPRSDGWIFIFNPNAVAATFRLTLTGDGNASTQTPVKIEPFKRYGFHINDLSPDAAASVVVQSDQDVVVSREIGVPTGQNLSVAPSVALRQ